MKGSGNTGRMRYSKYPNLEVVEDVKLWSVSLHKKFWVVKCGSIVYDVNRVHEGCP
jgi:hypothetical protein